jgi:hypothetical protein
MKFMQSGLEDLLEIVSPGNIILVNLALANVILTF